MTFIPFRIYGIITTKGCNIVAQVSPPKNTLTATVRPNINNITDFRSITHSRIVDKAYRLHLFRIECQQICLIGNHPIDSHLYTSTIIKCPDRMHRFVDADGR